MITKVSVAVRPPESVTVQVIAYVLSLSLSASVSAAAVGVPPRVACPPVSAVSDRNAGMSPPVSTQTCVMASPSTSVEATVWNENAMSS